MIQQNPNMYPPNYQMQNPSVMGPNPFQNTEQFPNTYQPVADKRRTYTPGQYQKGMAFYPPNYPPQNPGLPQPYMNNPPFPGMPQQQNPQQQQYYPQQQQYPQKQQLPQQQHPQQQHPQHQNPQHQHQHQHHQHQNQNQNQKKKTNNLKDTVMAQKNPIQPQYQAPLNDTQFKKTATLMTVNTLANLPYLEFEKAEYSHKPFYNICGYAFNSYNGKVKNYNEDRTKTIVNYPKNLIVKGRKISPRISYFGVFDGHGGKGCSDFLRNKLDSYLFNSKYFPAYPIQAIKEAFINAENAFFEKAFDKNRNTLVDKSGSCALMALIINDILYAINLGDSRALLSTDSGENLYQITRDHKPNDNIEKKRIEKSGAKVVYANTFNVDGKEIVLKESDYGEGFKFPYRIMPGGIAVSILFIII